MSTVLGTANDPVVCVQLAAAEPRLLAPGMVVVIDDEGCIVACSADYDTRLAGIVTGPGESAAVVLDAGADGVPVAIVGKCWVWADATQFPIGYGDLLTTSTTPGHARVATHREKSFGAVIGKALTALPSGSGLVRVLLSPR